MQFKLTLIFVLLLQQFTAGAITKGDNDNGTQITIDIPTEVDKQIYLAQYWKGQIFAIDSEYISHGKNVTFHSKSSLPQGQYMLFIKPDVQIEFLIGDNEKNINMILTPSDFTKSKIDGSKDSQLYWAYLARIQDLTTKATEISSKTDAPNITEKDKNSLLKQYDSINDEIKSYTKVQIAQNKGTWFSTFLKGREQVAPPISHPASVEDNNTNLAYIRQHYFDNIDLTDSRFWRTDYFITYVNNYIENWVDQSLDTLASTTSRLVSMAKPNNFCYEQMLSHFMNQAMESNVMGMENVWARLYEDYILEREFSGIDEKQRNDLQAKYSLIQYNRIGMTAQNIPLITIDGDSINTNDIEAEYTLLYFYSPSCGHCKTETPKINEGIYAKYKDKGLKITAINTTPDEKEWSEFVEHCKIDNWINCADLNHRSQYWMYYDVSGTPMTYLLNRNKKIIAKKIDEKNLEKVFDYLYSGK